MNICACLARADLSHEVLRLKRVRRSSRATSVPYSYVPSAGLNGVLRSRWRRKMDFGLIKVSPLILCYILMTLQNCIRHILQLSSNINSFRPSSPHSIALLIFHHPVHTIPAQSHSHFSFSFLLPLVTRHRLLIEVKVNSLPLFHHSIPCICTYERAIPVHNSSHHVQIT